MFNEEIEERRNALRQCWPTFSKQHWPEFAKYPPSLIAEVIDREKIEMSPDFCPWAPGLVVASDYLLEAAGYCPGSRRPSGWKEGRPNVFTKVIYGNRLMVRGCGELWSVERQNDEALAFPFGPVPMFTRTREAAMRLAEYCHPKAQEGEYRPFPAPRRVASSLRWVYSDPGGIMWNGPPFSFVVSVAQ
jgi:hypothetical protein